MVRLRERESRGQGSSGKAERERAGDRGTVVRLREQGTGEQW